jgi:hypothetical protein
VIDITRREDAASRSAGRGWPVRATSPRCERFSERLLDDSPCHARAVPKEQLSGMSLNHRMVRLRDTRALPQFHPVE